MVDNGLILGRVNNKDYNTLAGKNSYLDENTYNFYRKAINGNI